MLLLLLPLLLPGLLAWDPADGPEPWTQEELALFELVDEVNGTFYDLMDLTRNATKTDIKNRYKEMAVELHPDKNPEKEDEFKQLAAVYNMLKVKRTRAMYHRVLDEGLPDFRIPAFYERKVQVVRHIGLAEGIVTLLVLATLVQYGMAWAAFLERKFNSKMEKKKREKKPKKNQKEVEKTPEKEEEDDGLGPRPSVYDTLPFQLYELCRGAPGWVDSAKEAWREWQERRAAARREAEQEEEQRKLFEQRRAERVERKAGRQAGRT